MKNNFPIAVFAAIVSVSSYAESYKAPITVSSTEYEWSTNKTDADNCPVISVKNKGNKPYRLTVRYTHSGTTLGNSPSSESRVLTHGNFKLGESRDFEIEPGANCRRPNRLVIDEIRAELY